MIKGLYSLLQDIEQWNEIKSIIPGRISSSGTSGELRCRITTETHTGLKMIVRGSSAVQEVFLVTDDIPAVRSLFADYFLAN